MYCDGPYKKQYFYIKKINPITQPLKKKKRRRRRRRKKERKK